MKHRASVIALASAAVFASAAEAKTTCTRGADARVIEVVAPGEVGQSCDVRYTRGGGSNVSVPYHADNSGAFCNKKASEMVNRLASSGFTCASSAPALRADAASVQSDYVVEAKRPEPVAVAQAPVQGPVQEPAPAAQAVIAEPAPIVVAEAVQAEPEVDLQPVGATPALAASHVEAPEASALEDEMSKILAQPILESASGEPAQLVAQHAETPARPQPAAPVGRLVGAEPDAPRPAIQVTQASAVEQPPAETVPAEAVVEAPAPTAEQTQPKKPAIKPAAKKELRSPADVIRATLRAQAAAWNEGDLDGFMGSYWKSDDLKFVSGVNVTRGWNATMKRYRERYGGGEGLGQLGFEKLEVRLVTDDVAIVTGRFNHAQNGKTSGGLFSLVMRRDAGAWRIVHDHTSADPVQ